MPKDDYTEDTLLVFEAEDQTEDKRPEDEELVPKVDYTLLERQQEDGNLQVMFKYNSCLFTVTD